MVTTRLGGSELEDESGAQRGSGGQQEGVGVRGSAGRGGRGQMALGHGGNFGFHST